MTENSDYEIILKVGIIFRVTLNCNPMSGKREPRTWCYWKKKKERKQNQVGLLGDITLQLFLNCKDLKKRFKKGKKQGGQFWSYLLKYF